MMKTYIPASVYDAIIKVMKKKEYKFCEFEKLIFSLTSLNSPW